MSPQQLLRDVATWARANNIPKPSTKLGMEMLVRKYLAAQQQGALAAQAARNQRVHLVSDGATAQIEDNRADGGDDFDELLRDRSAAMAEANGDDLGRDAIMLDKARADLHRAAPFVRAQPPSILNGSLGGTASVKPGGPTQMVASWTGDDAETMPVTVTLGLIQQILNLNLTPATADIGLRPFARIHFGTRAAQTSVDVDIGQGCQLVVSGSQVQVEVGCDACPSTQSSFASMMLSAMLSFHPIVRTTPITRTLYFTPPLVAGGSQRFTVPPYARTVRVFRLMTSAPREDAVTINFFTSDGYLAYQHAVAAGTNMDSGILLSDDIAELSVANSGATDLLAGRVVFELAI